jgi:hypothetical protein
MSGVAYFFRTFMLKNLHECSETQQIYARFFPNLHVNYHMASDWVEYRQTDGEEFFRAKYHFQK